MPVKITATLVAVLGLVFAVSLVSFDTQEVQAAPATFKIDATHSTILFKINHLGVGNTWGRFNAFEGTFSLDGDNVTDCAVNVTVDTNSIDTANEGRDGHLKSPDFFNTAQFPEMTFKSTKVSKTTSSAHIDVTGDLTLHGVKKSVTVRVEKIGEADLSKVMPELGYRAGFEGTLKIKRSEFGMNHWVPNIGDEVAIILSFEGVKQ